MDTHTHTDRPTATTLAAHARRQGSHNMGLTNLQCLQQCPFEGIWSGKMNGQPTVQWGIDVLQTIITLK